jgi:hypothetical protein
MDEMKMVRDLLEAPQAPDALRERILRRTLAAPPARRPRGRRRMCFGAGLGLAAASMAVAAVATVVPGVIGRTGEPDVSRLPARGMLLAAAKQSAKADAGSGRYWHTRVQGESLDQVGAKKDPYVIVVHQVRDRWFAANPRAASWFIEHDGAVRPRGQVDENAWRRAGSPHRWHLNKQGVTTVPIEGDDLITDSQGASAVSEGRGDGRVVQLGDWLATVRDVQRLPTDPGRLRALLIARSQGSADFSDPTVPDAADALVFQVGARLLLEAPATPKVRAATYRMLADLPEVRSLGRVRDPLGRAGVGVAMIERPTTGELTGGHVLERQLIIDPRTGLLLANQVILIKPGRFESWAKPGWRWTYEARLDGGWTDSDPVRPAVDCAAPAPPPVCR